MKEQDVSGTLASVESVFHELQQGNDKLSEWIKVELPSSFWLGPNLDDLQNARKLVAWSLEPENEFRQAAIDEFADSADMMLIAQAKSIRATVVSREVSNPESKKRILFPDAAAFLGVTCLQPWDVYGALGLRL
ncbi:DUF4411 family protein [Corynebacterium belfantii]|uniref:DUF4411 family protein n=1 Tax=Corynebacterium belfantii TaxID=2014537 RepID=A0ABS0LAI7_9CORY|nr:DUF4411 family protein [Corynebacterium belfantii]MBG9353662.1 DUF4411 family protein [Corynebacterium belfantii]